MEMAAPELVFLGGGGGGAHGGRESWSWFLRGAPATLGALCVPTSAPRPVGSPLGSLLPARGAPATPGPLGLSPQKRAGGLGDTAPRVPVGVLHSSPPSTALPPGPCRAGGRRCPQVSPAGVAQGPRDLAVVWGETPGTHHTPTARPKVARTDLLVVFFFFFSVFHNSDTKSRLLFCFVLFVFFFFFFQNRRQFGGFHSFFNRPQTLPARPRPPPSFSVNHNARQGGGGRFFFFLIFSFFPTFFFLFPFLIR